MATKMFGPLASRTQFELRDAASNCEPREDGYDHRAPKESMKAKFESSGKIPDTTDGQINREHAAYSDNANAS